MLACVSAFGQSAPASLRVTVRTTEGMPAAGATVLVHYVEGKVDQTITAGPDGTFGIGNLTPGHYQLTATPAGFRQLLRISRGTGARPGT